MTKSTPKSDIPVNPPELVILDTVDGIQGSTLARFTPHGYQCRIILSPLVITRLLKWAFRNGYFSVVGNVYYVVDHSKRRLRNDDK